MKIETTKLLVPFILLLSLMWLGGCDERSISPLEESTGTYSVYGAVNIANAPNYIRVKDLTVPFLSELAEDLDATVTLEDLDTGTSTELEDTVVVFSGNITHNFIVEQQLETDRSYKLTVEGSDGTTVSSTVTTPAATEVQLSKFPNLDGDIVTSCSDQIRFTYNNVRQPESIRMEVGFLYEGSVQWSEIGKVAQLEYAQNGDKMFIEMSLNNLLVEVFPPTGIDNPGLNPRFLLPTVRCDELDTREAWFRYKHLGAEWASIDERLQGPLNPLESPVIENGLGFFGTFRPGEFSFTFVDPDDLE